MGYWAALVAEARDDYTLYLVAGAIVTGVIVRAASVEKSRIKGAVVLLALHLTLLPVVAWLRAETYTSYNAVRLASLTLAIVAMVGMASSLMFNVLLPRARVDVPPILRDVLMAVGAVVAVFALASSAGFNLSGLIA